MKPENAVTSNVHYDLTEAALEEALSRMRAHAKSCDVYELICGPYLIIAAISITKKINAANAGFFLKVTLSWELEEYEWMLRCGGGVFWSPGA